MKYQAAPEWRRFEEEITQVVQAFGYRAETTQASHDQGVDVIGWREGRKVIVQCKLYSRAGGPARDGVPPARDDHPPGGPPHVR